MTKALMTYSCGISQGNGVETNLFGSGNVNVTTVESRTQINATEGFTLSNLSGNIAIGGTGSNSVRVRKNSANGNSVITRTSTGRFSDAVNTDSFVSTDQMNLTYGVGGSSPLFSWVTALIEFASGFGCIHGSSGFLAIVDVGSATRYMPLHGYTIDDGSSAEANVQLKNRSYSSIESFAVNISANARVNNSVFRTRINGADGSGLITVGAGVTGIVEDVSVGDVLADGDLYNVSVTLLAGVEDLTLEMVSAFVKGTTNKFEAAMGRADGLARAASATANYLVIGGSATSLVRFSELQARMPTGLTGTMSRLRCYLSANTYTVAATISLMKNGTAAIVLTLGAGGGAAWYENTTDTVSFTPTDEFSFEVVGGTSGSATIHTIMVTLGQSANDTTLATKAVIINQANPLLIGAPGVSSAARAMDRALASVVAASIVSSRGQTNDKASPRLVAGLVFPTRGQTVGAARSTVLTGPFLQTLARTLNASRSGLALGVIWKSTGKIAARALSGLALGVALKSTGTSSGKSLPRLVMSSIASTIARSKTAALSVLSVFPGLSAKAQATGRGQGYIVSGTSFAAKAMSAARASPRLVATMFFSTKGTTASQAKPGLIGSTIFKTIGKTVQMGYASFFLLGLTSTAQAVSRAYSTLIANSPFSASARSAAKARPGLVALSILLTAARSAASARPGLRGGPSLFTVARVAAQALPRLVAGASIKSAARAAASARAALAAFPMLSVRSWASGTVRPRLVTGPVLSTQSRSVGQASARLSVFIVLSAWARIAAQALAFLKGVAPKPTMLVIGDRAVTECAMGDTEVTEQSMGDCLCGE